MKLQLLNKRFFLLISLLMAIGFSSASIAMKAPDLVVKETVDQIVSNIQKNRAAYRADNTKLFAMVEDVLVPTLHVPRMAKLILGKEHFPNASEAQKVAFAEEFKTVLMRTYATALLDQTGSEKVIYKPLDMKPGATKVKVEATLVTADGQAYPITLFMSNVRDNSWRAYNIKVAGLNFVSLYRNTYGDIIVAKGLDGLIADLAKKNAKSAG